MKYLTRIAFRNVRANFRHSLAALLSISAAFLAIVIFDGYVTHVRDIYLNTYQYRGMFGHLVLENENIRNAVGKADPWAYSLTLQQQEAIDSFTQQHSNQVVASLKNLTLVGSVTNGKVSSIFIARAFDVAEGLKMRSDVSNVWQWNVLYGEPFHTSLSQNSLSQNSLAAQKILVGQTLGHTMGCDPTSKERVITKEGGYRPGRRSFTCKTEDLQLSLTTESGQLNAMDFKPIGLIDAGYQEIDAKYLMLPLDQAQKLANTNKVSFYTLRLKNVDEVPAFITSFDQEVKTKFPALKLQTWQTHETGDLYKKTMELLLIFKNFVIIVIVLISCLSIFSTFVKNVKERTREIGLLLSLGFHRSQVMKIFLLESVFLSLLGISGGALVSLTAATILNSAQIYYRAGLLAEPVMFQVGLNPQSILGSALGLVAVAVLSCYLSISTTIKQKIVDCLQHV